MKRLTIKTVFVCVLASIASLLPSYLARAESVGAASEGGERFIFPTLENDATFRFTSFPDLFNWNIQNPQPGWEKAVDWFLTGMKKEGPAFSLVAGDIMDARWWTDAQEVRQQTAKYWGGFRKRFEDKDIDVYIAPGDHEYGDDQGLRKMHLTPIFAEQFSKILNMPRNGPDHKKGLAYSITEENLAVISVDTFEDAGDRMSIIRFDVEYGGRKLTEQHPHRGNGGPWSDVTITESTLRHGPRSVGKLVIQAADNGNKTVLATGKFAAGPK